MKKLLLTLLSAAFLLFRLPALAQNGGYDFWQTPHGTSIDLSGMNLGVIRLEGVPIPARVCNSSLILQRAETTPPGRGAIPVTVFALFLRSVGPVMYQGNSADLYVTLNNSLGTISTIVLPQPDSLAPSTGSMTGLSHSAFDLTITINADLIYVKAGASVSNSSNYLGHQAAPSATLKWIIHRSSAPPPLYPQNTYFPSGSSYLADVSDSQGEPMHLKIGPAKCSPTHSVRRP